MTETVTHRYSRPAFLPGQDGDIEPVSRYWASQAKTNKRFKKRGASFRLGTRGMPD